jgi:hypothetical protein
MTNVHYADTDWQQYEDRDLVRCPICQGETYFKDIEDQDYHYVATHYWCRACCTHWYSMEPEGLEGLADDSSYRRQ